MRNQTAGPSSPLSSYQLALVITSVFVSVLGLIGYILYVYLVRKHRIVSSNPFYTFALSMAIPDCVISLIMISYVYPINLSSPYSDPYNLSTIFSDPYPRRVAWTLGLLMNLCWFLSISHVVVIVANRILAVLCYTRVNSIFTRSRVIGLLASCYVFASCMTTLEYACGCEQFLAEGSWTLDCDREEELVVSSSRYCGQWPLTVDMYVSNGMTIGVLVGNLVIVLSARKATRRILQQPPQQGDTAGGGMERAARSSSTTDGSARRAANERSMIIQCCLVCSILAAYQASFWLMSLLKRRETMSAIDAAMTENLLASVNSSMHPLVYFVFSSEIRRKLRRRSTEKKHLQAGGGVKPISIMALKSVMVQDVQ